MFLKFKGKNELLWNRVRDLEKRIEYLENPNGIIYVDYTCTNSYDRYSAIKYKNYKYNIDIHVVNAYGQILSKELDTKEEYAKIKIVVNYNKEILDYYYVVDFKTKQLYTTNENWAIPEKQF